MFRNVFPAGLALIIILTFIIGCSSGSPDPLVPDNEPAIVPEVPSSTSEERDSQSNRALWGVWQVEFNTGDLSVKAIPARMIQAHYDITDHLLPPECSNCFELNVIGFDPVTRILEAEVTLRNPFQLSGRDVRGILYTNDYGHQLLNADDRTGLWDALGGSSLNPFIAFAKDEPNRTFSAGAEHQEFYMVYIPIPPAYQMITFAVDASWPGNCKDPYEIVDFIQDGELFDQDGSSVTVNVQVRDWQNDVSKVTLVAGAITGEGFTQMNHDAGDSWSLELMNNTYAAAGEYTLRIIADSTNSPGVPLYDFVTVLISEYPSINVIGISPDIGNAGYEYPGVEIGGEGFHGPLAQVLLQMTGQDDIPAANVNVVDPGLITCDLELPIVAELGLWDVKVINDGGPFGIGTELFEITAVTPEVTAIDPDNAYPNQGVAGATIFGGFFQGPGAQVKLKKTGQPDMETENVVVVNENQITCDFQVPFAAAQGLWDIEVINGTGISGTGAGLFNVIPQTPVIHYTDPNTAYAGSQLVDVIIEGNHFQGPPGAIVVLKMPGVPDIVAENVAVLAQETISFDINLPYDAKPGMYDVDVTTGYSISGVGIDVFEILEPIPNSPIEITPDSLNWSPLEIDIELGKAYVAGGYNGLHIFDLTDPENPQWQSKIGTHQFAYDVCVNGNYAYVSDMYKGLYIFDISTPGSPAYVNHLVLSNYPKGIDYHGGYIYLADNDNLLIIDVDPPASAYVEKTVTIIGSSVWTTNVKQRDGYAYVCCGDDGLHIVDVDPISTASIVASLPANGSGTQGIIDLTFQGDYAYVCDAGYGVLVVDIYSPASPSQVHSVSSWATGIALIPGEDYLCVGAGYNVDYIDISVPTSAYTDYQLPCDGDAPGTPVVDGNYAYLPDRGTHLRIFDISDPTSAFETNSIKTPGGGVDVVIENDFAYVPCFAAGLMIVDCTDPYYPWCVNSIDTWEAMSCAVSGEYAYVRDNEEGLRIMDIFPPESAYIVNSVVPGFGIHAKLDYSNGYVYATSWTDGMYVIDVDPPGSASTINTLTTTDSYNDVHVVGNYAYIAGSTEGVHIIDISIPGSESIIKTAPVAGDSPNGIYVDDGYAYVIGNDFHILDIDPPAGASVVKSVTIPGYPKDIVTQGGFAYVVTQDGSTQENKVVIIDIWPPASASILTSIDVKDWPSGVDINGNLLYVAENSGLRIYQLW